MTSFCIFAKGSLIGHSLLEAGDPPMGVAFGVFFPGPGYEGIKADVVRSYGHQAHLELSATTDHGRPIECQAVAIQDLAEEFGQEGLTVELLGIPGPEYRALFPHHVAVYERQFPSET